MQLEKRWGWLIITESQAVVNMLKDEWSLSTAPVIDLSSNYSKVSLRNTDYVLCSAAAATTAEQVAIRTFSYTHYVEINVKSLSEARFLAILDEITRIIQKNYMTIAGYNRVRISSETDLTDRSRGIFHKTMTVSLTNELIEVG